MYWAKFGFNDIVPVILEIGEDNMMYLFNYHVKQCKDSNHPKMQSGLKTKEFMDNKTCFWNINARILAINSKDGHGHKDKYLDTI